MKTKITSLFLAAALAVSCGLAVDATYVQSEVGIPYTPTAAVSAGDVLVLSNSLVAVALSDIAADALGSIMLRGVFEMAHAAETTYVGQNVYWDEDGDQYGNATTGTGAITTTAAGNHWCGWAIEAATATDSTVRVMLYPLGNVDATTLTVSGNGTIGGTFGVTGATTLTGNAIVNEIDARTATALLLGKATATGVTIGASDAGVTVPGTLAVTGVATLTAAPALVSTNTPGAITLTMTNAPTLADDGKAAPVYINVTIGGVGHVIPAWPLAAE